MPKADPWMSHAQVRVHHVCTAGFDAFGDKTMMGIKLDLIWIKVSGRNLLQFSTSTSVNREMSVPTAVEPKT